MVQAQVVLHVVPVPTTHSQAPQIHHAARAVLQAPIQTRQERGTLAHAFLAPLERFLHQLVPQVYHPVNPALSQPMVPSWVHPHQSFVSPALPIWSPMHPEGQAWIFASSRTALLEAIANPSHRHALLVLQAHTVLH